MNEKYEAIIKTEFKCCTCGKLVPDDSIIINNDRLFNCPHCNKAQTPKIQKHYEKKIIEVYTTPRGAVIKNPSSYHGVKHRHQEEITIEVA